MNVFIYGYHQVFTRIMYVYSTIIKNVVKYFNERFKYGKEFKFN